MNLLIPHGRLTDKYLSRAAQEMGHTVHFMCNHQESNKLGTVRRVCLPDYWVPLKTRYDLRYSIEDYSSWYQTQLFEYVEKYEIDAILPCSSMDAVMTEVAGTNEYFTLPGIHPEQAEFFKDKTVYLPAMAEAGVRVPKIFEIVEPRDEPKKYDHPYPVVAKPGLGCGGFGIYRASTEDELRRFFSASDKEESFSERGLFYQDRDFAGRPKHYLHFGMGGRYLVQQWIPGPCISLAGTIVDGVLELDLVYDIGITEPPNCSEINFGWPSVYPEAEEAASRLVNSINTHRPDDIEFPDGAFMADAILHEGELWLVDFSVRMSSSGTKMLYHTCGDLSYSRDVINAALGEVWKTRGTSPAIPTFYSFFPFPKGRITNIKYPEPDNHPLVNIDSLVTLVDDGCRVYEMRNDVQVSDRGWIVATARCGSRTDAETVVDSFIDNIQYDID